MALLYTMRLWHKHRGRGNVYSRATPCGWPAATRMDSDRDTYGFWPRHVWILNRDTYGFWPRHVWILTATRMDS